MSELVQRPLSRTLRAYRFVNRPYYWYRPSQLAIRLRTKASPDGTPRLVRTAWGSLLYCWPDPLGLAVARTGVYDLIVAETLARLADPGETVVDAGANVGFMSNLLAHAVGSSGRVISFEPHPLIFQTLESNVSRWRAIDRLDTIDIRQAAVSSSAGVLALTVDPDTFAHNKGTASLEPLAPDPVHSTDVETVRLADELSMPIGVLKLDVERHELAALRGAEALLRDGLIRDILFEEHEPPPTPVTALLQSHGYTVLGARQGPFGPILSAPTDAYSKQLWDPPALLATLDPARARRRLKRRGWTCLTGRLRAASAS
jgi:FkbM family methyltransferase